jgi:hypothetical protein
MMHRTCPCAPRSRRRGLTLVELILALSVTALIAGAIAGMMAAVSNGVQVRRDSRSLMIRASAAHSRLDAYLSACRCLLAADDGGAIIWLHDDRESETIHASEIRWLLHDPDAGAIDVYYVDLPSTWTDLQRDLADREYQASADWMIILGQYEARGLISQVRLVDGIASVAIETDHAKASESRLITYDLELSDGEDSAVIRATSAIANHQEPTS